jgi:hypothetical protein
MYRVVNIGKGKNLKFLSTWRKKTVQDTRRKVQGSKLKAQGVG